MPVHNVEIAGVLTEFADLLEIQEANPFRVRAYRNAARTVESLSREVTVMIDVGEDLTALPGIGADLAGRIAEIAERGTALLLDEYTARCRRRSPSCSNCQALVQNG